jgi:deferrochelatase/peroxidase EfeB
MPALAAKGNPRRGIDDNPADYLFLVKVNVPFDDRDKMIAVLKAVQQVQEEKLDPKRTFSEHRLPDGGREPRFVVADLHLNLLVAFGLRFFLGPLGSHARTNEQPIPNFPPGGSFTPRTPNRFGINDRSVPLYLRTMNASGDQDWITQQLTAANGGQAPSADEVNTAYSGFLAQGECDLLFQVECEFEFVALDLLDALRSRVIDPMGLEIAGIQRGNSRGDGKAHIGFFDGTSNMQQMLRDEPQTYRSKIYLPTPSAAYPGQSTEVRDDPRYDGGTYLAYRKYSENLDLWFSDDFEITDFYGKTYKGAEARLHAIGKNPHSSKAINRASHKELEAEPDHTEINLSYNEAHALKARGGQTAPFMGPFPPVAVGHSNAFNTQDIRLRRRGIAYNELNPATGKIDYGLQFICFQNNIQQTGFEFVNNIWLINPDFRRSTDGLMNPVGKIITPLEGAYFFVPPEAHDYPGDVFFE